VPETITRGCVQLVIIFLKKVKVYDLVVHGTSHCTVPANTFEVDSQPVPVTCAPLAGMLGVVVDQTTGSVLCAHALGRRLPGPGVRRAAGGTVPQ
jgi:hypothetical protein